MIRYHSDLIQGSEEWYAARCGLLTASEMKHIITYDRILADREHKNNPNKRVETKKKPKKEVEKEQSHLYELLAQRITKHVEPSYISDDMLRGQGEESYARETYHEKYAKVETCGFITNDKWGFTLGYSPDGLVGENGIIECKSRRQKFQAEVILSGEVPDDFKIQIQTGLLVSERGYCDFISYCGGMHMTTIRVEADAEVEDAIVESAKIFHLKMEGLLERYAERLADTNARLIPTERRIEQEMFV